MLDRLTGMAVFVAAADAGSFAAAAGPLGLSPQMVARHVAALETRLGVRMLNRTTRSQGLTETGRTYYERCRIVLAEVEAADARAGNARAEPHGRLRISAPVTFGAHSLAPVVARYMRDHPKVDVDLFLTDRFVDLINEDVEATIRIGPLADSELIARTLAPYRLVACASPAYLRERGTPVIPDDLAGHDCLGYAYRTRPIDKEWLFTRDGRTHAVRISRRLEVNDGVALLSVAVAGGGIVLAAEDVLRHAIDDGRLVRVLPGFDPPSRPMHLVYVADRRQTPKLRAFIDAVSSAFGSANKAGDGAVADRHRGRTHAAPMTPP